MMTTFLREIFLLVAFTAVATVAVVTYCNRKKFGDLLGSIGGLVLVSMQIISLFHLIEMYLC